MTTHLRTQIRDAVSTAVTGLTTTGSRVHKSYMAPVDSDALPCLLVNLSGGENISGADVGGAQERDIDVTVSGFAKAVGDVDAILNQIAIEVETALAAVPTLSGKCTRLWLERIESDIDTSLERPAGRIDLGYRAKYFTAAGAPGTLI